MAKRFTDDSFRRVAQVVVDHERERIDLTTPPTPPDNPLPFQFRRFELTEAFSINEDRDPDYLTAEAYFLNSAGRAEDGSQSQDRGSFIVTDLLGSRVGLVSGSQGTCYHPHDVDRWEVIDMLTTGALVLRFELKYAMTPGDTVDAYYLDATGEIQEDVVFAVTDILETRRGRAFVDSETRGSQGYAVFTEDGLRFEILDMQPHALRISGTSDVTVASDEHITLVNPVIMSPTGALAMEDLTAEFLVKNDGIFEWEIDSGGLVHAAWNEAAEQWEAVQAKCPAP